MSTKSLSLIEMMANPMKVINHNYPLSRGTWVLTWTWFALFTTSGIFIVKRLSELIFHLCHGKRSYIFFIYFHCTIFPWKCLRNPHMPWHWVVAPMISIRIIKPINLLKQFSEAAATPRQRWTKPWRYIAQRRVCDWSLPRYTKRTSTVSYHYHKQIRASLPR